MVIPFQSLNSSVNRIAKIAHDTVDPLHGIPELGTIRDICPG